MEPTSTLLIAENNPVALKTSAEYFTKYERALVIPVKTRGEAELAINLRRIDAAIIDIRLTDDEDEADRSGLELAEEAVAKEPEAAFPFILYSKYGGGESAIDTSDPPHGTGIPRITFVSKEEGLERLAEKVREQIRLSKEAAQVANEIEVATASSWSKQHKALMALASLLLALVCGSVAMLFGEPKLLAATLLFAILAVVFIGLSLE
jgi:DNA-binding NarL/FixJ family response regulator